MYQMKSTRKIFLPFLGFREHVFSSSHCVETSPESHLYLQASFPFMELAIMPNSSLENLHRVSFNTNFTQRC